MSKQLDARATFSRKNMAQTFCEVVTCVSFYQYLHNINRCQFLIFCNINTHTHTQTQKKLFSFIRSNITFIILFAYSIYLYIYSTCIQFLEIQILFPSLFVNRIYFSPSYRSTCPICMEM